MKGGYDLFLKYQKGTICHGDDRCARHPSVSWDRQKRKRSEEHRERSPRRTVCLCVCVCRCEKAGKGRKRNHVCTNTRIREGMHIDTRKDTGTGGHGYFTPDVRGISLNTSTSPKNSPRRNTAICSQKKIFQNELFARAACGRYPHANTPRQYTCSRFPCVFLFCVFVYVRRSVCTSVCVCVCTPLRLLVFAIACLSACVLRTPGHFYCTCEAELQQALPRHYSELTYRHQSSSPLHQILPKDRFHVCDSTPHTKARNW